MVRRSEGDWFAVPLAAGGYAVGLVARAPGRGHTLFGYFFGPIRKEAPSSGKLDRYLPGEAVYVCRFYDDALVSGRWPTLRTSDTWDRSEWPMPEFHMPDSHFFAGQSFALRYSEDKPEELLMQREIPLEEEANYPPDHGVYPPEHLEHLVGEMLGAPSAHDEAEEHAGPTGKGVTHWLRIPPEAVEEARRQLAPLGFDEIAAHGERNGLVDVLVTQHGDLATLRSSLDKTEATLTDLADSLGGEYDGTEWALA